MRIHKNRLALLAVPLVLTVGFGVACSSGTQTAVDSPGATVASQTVTTARATATATAEPTAEPTAAPTAVPTATANPLDQVESTDAASGDPDSPGASEVRIVKNIPAIDIDLTLVTAGSEPRSTLRYQFANDVTEPQVLELTQLLDIEPEGARRVTTAISYVMTSDVYATVTDGGYHIFTTMSSASTSEDTDPVIADVVNPTLIGVPGTMAAFSVSDRGLLLRSSIMESAFAQVLGPEGSGGGLAGSGLALNMVPLPEEPVGIGASWTSYFETFPNEIVVSNTYTYTLTGLSDDGLEIVVEILSVAADDSTISSPDGDLEVVQLTTTGTGRLALNLSKVVPDRATSSTTTTQVFRTGEVESTNTIGLETNTFPRTG